MTQGTDKCVTIPVQESLPFKRQDLLNSLPARQFQKFLLLCGEIDSLPHRALSEQNKSKDDSVHIDEQQWDAMKPDKKGAFFESLFRASPSPFLIVKPDTPRFTIVDANDAYLRAIMRKRDELIGHGIAEAFRDNLDEPSIGGASILISSFDRVLATRQPDCVTGIRCDVSHLGGVLEKRWWSLVNTAMLDENGEVEGIFHNANNITKQFLAEAKLRQSEQRIELALQATDLAVYEWDLVTDRLTVNERFNKIFGIGPDESAVGALVLAHCVHPDDRMRIDACLARAMDPTSSGQFVFEHRLTHLDHCGELWVLNHGRVCFDEHYGSSWPVRAFGTVQDITARKHTELKLRDAEARQRHLIDSWVQAVWETDAAGQVVEDSASWRAYTGQTLEEWRGYGWLDAIHPEDRAYAERQWSEAVEVKGFVNAEFRLRAPDGGWRWTNVRAAPLFDVRGNIEKWAGMNIDIDKRKRTETALRENEERYRALFESIDEGFCIIQMLFDSQGTPNDYRFLELNPVFEKQARFTIASGQRIREIAPHHEQFWFDTYGRIALTGEPARFEHHALTFGVDYDVYAFRVGEPAQQHVAVLFRDITQRKRDEAELRYRSEQFEMLIQMAPIGVCLVDSEFRIAQVNPVARPVFGKTLEPIGSDFDKVIHSLLESAEADEIEALFRHTLKTGKPHYTPEQAKFHADRECYEYYAWGINRITLPNGRYGVVCYFNNISEQVQARLTIAESEQKHLALSKALQTADERKNEFLATLAHELRNPLAPLRTGLSILDRSDCSISTAVRMREVMHRQLTHMVRLIDDLLDMSRVTQGKVALKMSFHSLQSVVELALETFRPVLDAAGQQLHVDMPSEPVLLTIDATRIAQALINILNNAAKFSPDGSELRLRAECIAPDRVRLQIQDNGIGMPSDMLESVFDLFTQVRQDGAQSQGGLGIGLSLSRRLIELHGGTVRASSSGLGKGSTFTLELPTTLAQSPNTGLMGSGNSEPTSEADRRSVLVVDDNVDAAMMLAMVLELDGHSVRTVHTGNDAINAYNDGIAPDLLFLDIGLPDISGYEVAAELRQRRAFDHTVIIALTGRGNERDKQRSTEVGFDFHLTKPIAQEKLREVMKALRH